MGNTSVFERMDVNDWGEKNGAKPLRRLPIMPGRGGKSFLLSPEINE